MPITRRRRARECAVETLYELDVAGGEPEHVIFETARRHKLDSKTRNYLNRLVTRTVAERAVIDAALAHALEKWDVSRLGFTDRAVLRMAGCEIMFFPDIPPRVVINEAVDLARLYGDEQSSRFVNGVLDAVARTVTGGQGMTDRAAAPGEP